MVVVWVTWCVGHRAEQAAVQLTPAAILVLRGSPGSLEAVATELCVRALEDRCDRFVGWRKLWRGSACVWGIVPEQAAAVDAGRHTGFGGGSTVLQRPPQLNFAFG